jgi:phage terminase large subunit-like protein
MIKYPLAYNPILEYWSQIESGEIVVCDKIIRTYKKVVFDINNKASVWYYEPKRANHVIEFFENYCRHSKGKLGGKKIVLELWEKALLATIFGFIDVNGIRKYREAILIVGKKNGKSLLASGTGLYLQVCDSEPGAEVYAVATKKDQAKIVWSEAKRMVTKSPALRKRMKTLVSEIRADLNDSTFKPLASDADTLDGKNVHGALMDEFHQWKYGAALYDIIADGITAREQPLILLTSTASKIREDIYDQKYDEAKNVINGYFDVDGYKDERLIAFIYELDKREEWTDPKKWMKANPGLGTIKNRTILAEKVEKAKQNPRLVKNLVCKEFNIPETSNEAWLSFEELNNTMTFDVRKLKPDYGIGGADLSSTTDLTAAKVLFMLPNDNNIYVLQMYWMAEDLLDKRIKEDKTPYDIWLDQGYIRVCPGNNVHAKYVTEWFLEVRNEYDIYLPWIGYDAWSAKYWVEEMQGHFGKQSMIPVHQGKKTLSGPMKLLGTDLASNKIIYNNNPIDKWCLSNTAIEEDKNLNIQPCKSKNQRRRIDGTSALLDAYVVLQDKMQDYQNMI